MKFIIGLIFTFIFITLIHCGGDTSKEDQQLKQAQAMETEVDQMCKEAADKLTVIFTDELLNELVMNLSEKPASKAIEVCQVQAPRIASIFSINGIKIKRVASKYRNPDNRATTRELEKMGQFAPVKSSSDSSAQTKPISEWVKTDSSEVFYYYKPIYIKSMCLDCHGTLQTLALGVIEAVRRHYPNDKATGFSEGDLRGMFVVEIRWPAGKDYAEEIIKYKS